MRGALNGLAAGCNLLWVILGKLVGVDKGLKGARILVGGQEAGVTPADVPLADLRDAARAEARGLAAATDSVAQAQRELGRTTQDLARERERTSATTRPGQAQTQEQLGYQAAERAGEIGQGQRAVIRRAEELRRRVEQLERTAQEAGLTDPAWQEQAAEPRRLLHQAVTPARAANLRHAQAPCPRARPPESVSISESPLP